MRFRLEGEEIRSLYVTGRSSRVPSDVVVAIFGVLEAIEAAAGPADLRSLVSLRFNNHPTSQFEFGLPFDWRLVGRHVVEAGVPLMVIDGIREERGGLGD